MLGLTSCEELPPALKCPEVVVWTAEFDKAFNALKNLLTSTPVLSSPDLEKTFILQADASNYSVSAVLSQTDGEGLDHPVAYYILAISYLTESRNTPQSSLLARYFKCTYLADHS